MNPDKPRISIIIPVLNEADTIGKLLSFLIGYSQVDRIHEILVIDGGSEDSTCEQVLAAGCALRKSCRGRAVQMNHGAQWATGDILYFLHADTFPPADFDQAILRAVTSGHEAGCFRMRFDSCHPFLTFFSWFSKFNYCFCRGGDQSLFVTKKLFTALGGFNEAYRIYEDNEFIGRLYGRALFTVLPGTVTTSARRYHQIRMLKLQFHFGMMHIKNYLGAGPEDLYDYYRKNIAI